MPQPNAPAELPLWGEMNRNGAASPEADGPALHDGSGCNVAQEGHWLGLTTDSRTLGGWLQDGWMRPGTSGYFLLGVDAYARHAGDSDSSIEVRLRIDAAKLPRIDVHAFHGGTWTRLPLDGVGASGTVLCWPCALPTFAVAEMTVSTASERSRLENLARGTSNVEFPSISLAGEGKPLAGLRPPSPPRSGVKSSAFKLPPEMNSAQGAMCMAMWAVPPLPPWLDVLVESLAVGRQPRSVKERRRLVEEVEATWWLHPPWARNLKQVKPKGKEERLWVAAAIEFRANSGERASASLLLDSIARRAQELSSKVEKREDAGTEHEHLEWLHDAEQVLNAEVGIDFASWRDRPVGLAILLVLLRPDPLKFASWKGLRSELPPGVWWSAAALCGLHNGYRTLDKRFRGPEEMRPHIALRAFSASARTKVDWPLLEASPLPEQDMDKGNEVAIKWGDAIWPKPGDARHAWHFADLHDDAVERAAASMARKLEWPCLDAEIELGKGEYPVQGTLKVRRRKGEGLALQVSDPVRIKLLGSQRLRDALDPEKFLRFVATAPGDLPAPSMSGQQRGTVTAESIPGLVFRADFLTEDEERRIMNEIDRSKWSSELSRRVQHYGWRYDYKKKMVGEGDYLGKLPDWAARLAERIKEATPMPDLPDQVIVNEYVGDQGITKHVDSHSFGDCIATVSLLESWHMVFRRTHPKRAEEILLARRSLLVLQGEAHYGWTHEIPKRISEPTEGAKGERRERGRRISLTFRKVQLQEPRKQTDRRPRLPDR